jgi:cell division transport system ATP-binding protein
MTPMVKAEEVCKSFGALHVLKGITLEVGKGEVLVMVGPSGSGKSTFIRLLIKEFDPTEGSITVGGRSLGRLRRSKVPYLRRAIGCVFQDYKLLAGRTVYDNVAYALQVIGENPRSTRRKVPEILALVGLSDKGERYPNEL